MQGKEKSGSKFDNVLHVSLGFSCEGFIDKLGIVINEKINHPNKMTFHSLGILLECLFWPWASGVGYTKIWALDQR